MVAAILLVGDELLAGAVSDRNVVTIASALAEKDVPVVQAEIVSDDPEAIAAGVTRLGAVCDLLVVTGGLGPTEDDRTREGLGRALGVGMRVDEEIRGRIESRLRSCGLAAGPAAVRQASLPEGTEPVPNPVGSAPGFRGRLEGCEFWVLPGVPAEAREMVRTLARELPGPAPGRGGARIVATAGLSEVRVANRLEEAGFRPPEGVALGYLPGPGGVRLRLFAPGGAPAGDLDAAEARLRELLGRGALPEQTIEASLVRELARCGDTLATAESCTGGLVGARITDVPGASSVYFGGVVTYSDRSKVDRLGVPRSLLQEHGAVSEPVARAMAEGARKAFGAARAVSVTGIAGPGGGSAAKPVGTVWIGVADGRGAACSGHRFSGSRAMIRERTVNKVLEMAYRRSVGEPA